MLPLKIMLPLLALLVVNIVVSLGYLSACAKSDAPYLILGDVTNHRGYQVNGRVRMTIAGALYGFFWLPIVIYNLCSPKKRKFHLGWGPNSHSFV